MLGIDIDIRAHNKNSIESHPMSRKITMFEGSSISDGMILKVHEFAKRGKKILVCTTLFFLLAQLIALIF